MLGWADLVPSVDLMAAWLSSDRLYLCHSVFVCVSVGLDGDREEVERHLRADYSVPVTGGRRVSHVMLPLSDSKLATDSYRSRL